MPFLLYKLSDHGTTYRQIHEIALAGKKGPFAKHVLGRMDGGGSRPLEWHLSEAALLQQLDANDVDGNALLIDLKPNVHGNVSLYRLCDVWGFSYETWTPLALRLRPLFIDRDAADPPRFKAKFSNPPQHPSVHEFLYLQGGTNKGTWTWGRVGSVNGALLWPDALRYFLRSMVLADWFTN